MSIIRQLARVANRIDSASTGTFLSKGDSTGDFTLVNYTDLSGRPTTLDSAALTTIVDSAYIQLRQTSAGSGGLDSAGITAIVDSNYVVARSPAASSGFANYEYTATAGQTTFQDSDINGNVMSYTADGIFVFYNGVLIAPTTDYTASDGSSVVLTTGADSGSHVAISKWNIASGGSGGSSANWYGDRGIFSSVQSTSTSTSLIDYFDITTTGNATDFGDLTDARNQSGAVSNDTYGVIAAGFSYGSFFSTYSDRKSNVMDYITIATPSNATTFGDLTDGRYGIGAVSDGTYGLFAGGEASIPSLDETTLIDYITIATIANATTFGDLTERREQTRQGASDGTYGVFGGGNQSGTGRIDTMDYVTIASPSNATDFGNLTTGKSQCSGSSDNATYGFFMGGLDTSATRLNVIEYITIATPGNATDFGDLTLARFSVGSTSNESRVVCGGGANVSNVIQNIIDYFSPVTPTNASDFGDLTVTTRDACATSGSPS